MSLARWRTPIAGAVAVAVAATTVLVGSAAPAVAAAGQSLIVDFSHSTGQFRGGAAGSLYGLGDKGVPSQAVIDGAHVTNVSQKPPAGAQHPSGDALQVENEFFSGAGKDFAVGQIFPYPVARDHYGQRILPESLGNIEYDIHTIDPSSSYNYTWQDIVTNASYGLAVHDGYASFFFHPFWLEPELGVPGFDDFRRAVEGISQLGYSWVVASTVR